MTRGITWCIDRCAASTRAIPAANQPSYLPQALLPLSLASPRLASRLQSLRLSPPPFPSLPSPFPFTRPSVPTSRPRTTILHRSLHFCNKPLALPSPLHLSSPRSSTPLDETPSDIHRRVSSELIIKCIVVPTPTSRGTHPLLFTLIGSRETSLSPSLSSPRRHTPATRHGSSRIFGWRSRDSQV